jgi:hypothetical protein
LPPVVPLALMSEAAVVFRSPEARRNTRPPSRTTLSASMLPALLTRPAARPMRPASAAMRPRFFTSPAVPVMATETPGVPVSTSCTFWPAASSTSPLGAFSVPVLVTPGATR